MRCGFRLRKIWISPHLLPKLTLNPMNLAAPDPDFFYCSEFSAELISCMLINQGPLEPYVGYPCSSMKYHQAICLGSTHLARQGLVIVYENLGPLRCSTIFQLKLDDVSPITNFWWGSTQNRIEVKSHTGIRSTDLRMDWSMKEEYQQSV